MSAIQKGLRNFYQKLTTVELTEENAMKALEEFKILLLTNDVAFDAAEKICKDIAKSVKGQKIKRFTNLQKALEEPAKKAVTKILKPKYTIDLIEEAKKKKELLKSGISKDEYRPLVVLFLGINGTGKTTTIAKIAYMLKKNDFRVVIAAADTFRSGAQEQLATHAKKIGVKIIQGKYGSDPAAVAYDAVEHAKARLAHVVLIDTAGRMTTNQDLMREMKKIKNVVQPDYTLLVVDALAGNDAANQAREFANEVGIDGIILTKMDADAKGGAALSVTYVTGGKPICYIGTGQDYNNIEPFNPKKFAKTIFSSNGKKK